MIEHPGSRDTKRPLAIQEQATRLTFPQSECHRLGSANRDALFHNCRIAAEIVAKDRSELEQAMPDLIGAGRARDMVDQISIAERQLINLYWICRAARVRSSLASKS